MTALDLKTLKLKILVTGAAGFIGFHLIKALQNLNHQIIGIDNLNDYYDPQLKLARLKALGFDGDSVDKLLMPIKKQNDAEKEICYIKIKNKNLSFIKLDLVDRTGIIQLFEQERFDIVVNLAAQAGVRYSIQNPYVYVDSNIVGFLNILEGCRQTQVKHFVYASSSSVYGMNSKQPFSTVDSVDYPISIYAATKKANELMAHTYSHLYGIPTTGLRFFTVYGPFGRPDMAYFSFTQKILKGESISVFNNGIMKRDFTYIDDIVQGVMRVMERIPVPHKNEVTNAQAPYKIYNIGNNQPVTLRRFITAIESACNQKAKENLLPMQQGDVPVTYADVDSLIADTDFRPSTSIEEGITEFVKWYKDFYV